MVNEDTALLFEDISIVLQYLFDNYNRVPTEEVKEKEAEIWAMTFHPTDPIVTLFNPIEWVKNLVVSTKIPYTELQILDIGLTVIQNTGDFERALG